MILIGIVKSIFDLCYAVMTTGISLFGYDINLWQVFLYSAIGFIILYFLFRIFN